MLSSSYRLRRSADINRVYKQGSYCGAKNIYMRVRKTRLPVSRAAVVVSKKISKRAVVRNRIRRRISEILRLSWPTIAPGFDIIVLVRSDISQLKHSELQNEVSFVLKKAKLSQ